MTPDGGWRHRTCSFSDLSRESSGRLRSARKGRQLREGRCASYWQWVMVRDEARDVKGDFLRNKNVAELAGGCATFVSVLQDGNYWLLPG